MRWTIDPIKPVSTYGIAVEKLRQQIALGLVAPGQKLAPERRLAEELGVSRVTLRDALRVLEAERLISVKRGVHGGAIVANEIELEDIFLARVSREPAAAFRAMEFRLITERAAARLAAVRRRAIDLAHIRRSLEEMEEAISGAVFRSAEAQFRIGVAEASQNAWLVDAIIDAMAIVCPPLIRYYEARDPKLVDGHRAVFAAVEARDEDLAERAITETLGYELQTLKALSKLKR